MHASNERSCPEPAEDAGPEAGVEAAKGDYLVSLEPFAGPLDLLLYLIRQNEVDIFDIPIADITAQYLAYMHRLRVLDIGRAGEFLVLAATLIDIKTKMMLPPSESGEEEDVIEEDPRHDLVLQLLEYRRMKAAAYHLEDRAEALHGRFTRGRTGRPAFSEEEKGQHCEGDDRLAGLDVGMLINAFAKVLQETLGGNISVMELDDVPVEHYVERIRARFMRERMVRFHGLFQGEKTRVAIIGTFLAVLEMIRLREIRVEQREDFGEILIYRNREIARS